MKSLASNFAMPEFGVGTWQVGGQFERDPNADPMAAARALRQALDAGLRHVDTAEIYAAGLAEEIVARAIQGLDREQLFIVSKVAQTHLHYADVLRAAEGSLRRLKTDYLDLYLIHAPNPQVPMEETFRALSELKQRQLIKNIGVSNFTVARMEQAARITEQPIVATQVHYNLIFREPEVTGLIDYCIANKILVIAWRPVQKGAIAKECPSILRTVCEKYGKTPAQVAINWLISQPGIVTLSTMRSAVHLTENLGALEWEMSKQDIELLRQGYPGQQSRSDAVPLG